jgi:hypothetical protein
MRSEAAGLIQPVTLAGEQLLEVAEPLRQLLPGGGLRRGSLVSIESGRMPGETTGGSGSISLALALVAAESAAGAWVAIVGLPDIGVVSVAETGLDLSRVAFVPSLRPRDWLRVVAVLVDSLDIVISRLPRLSGSDTRRLAARVRQRRSVMVFADGYPGQVDLRLRVGAARWEGLHAGWGHLRARRVDVLAQGRGAAARPRRVQLWLPSPDGLACVGAASIHDVAEEGSGVTA